MTRIPLTLAVITLLGCTDPGANPNPDGDIGDNIDPGDDIDDGIDNDDLEAGHAYGLIETDDGLSLVDMESGETVQSYNADTDTNYHTINGVAAAWFFQDESTYTMGIVKVPGGSAELTSSPKTVALDNSGNAYTVGYSGEVYKMTEDTLIEVGTTGCESYCSFGSIGEGLVYVHTDSGSIGIYDLNNLQSVSGGGYELYPAAVTYYNGDVLILDDDNGTWALTTTTREILAEYPDFTNVESGLQWSTNQTLWVVAHLNTGAYVVAINLNTGAYEKGPQITNAGIPLALYVAE